MKPVRRAIEWLEHRTGVETAVRSFLFDSIPASAGWPQVFGSIALFLFLTQAFTGILLAFNYAPTPGDAYNSLTYIMHEVTGGEMIRALHHWGASMMIVVVVIHMTQVFVFGAYKKPRETTWIVGVILLLLTLGFGLTGYLLPWDNRAYWGTTVTTKIVQQVPLIGGYLLRLMGAENGVGVITFARFYGLHVLILPASMAVLVGIHIYLVRRHGVTPAPQETRPNRRFYPEQAFRDVLAVFIAFVVLFMAAVFLKVPLERLADPTDTSYVPRPEWYFLFLFQTLKFFQGSLEPIGSIVLPTMAIAALFCVPFIDRRQLRKVSQRGMAIGLVFIALGAWAALTSAAMTTTQSSPQSALLADGAHEWIQLSPEELAGIGYFRQERCESCHNLLEGEPKPGPTLATVPVRRSAAWMIEHFKNPSQMIPGSNMPPIRLSDSELNALSAFLLKLTPENVRTVADAPPEIVEGAHVYVTNGCGGCHKVNGIGGEMGPSLNGLASRRSKEWVEKHFLHPRALSPKTIMPPYKFSPAEQTAILLYLFLLPG